MNTRKDLPLLVATLCAVVTVSAAASAETPAHHAPTHGVAPDKNAVAAPAPATPLRRVAPVVSPGKAPASKVPATLDLKTRAGEGEAQPAAPAPADAARVVGGRQRVARTIDARQTVEEPLSDASPVRAPRVIEFPAGDHVDVAILTLIGHANATGIPHKGTFNGFELIARPGDDPKTVGKPMARALEAGRKEFEALREKVLAQIAAESAARKPPAPTPPQTTLPAPGSK